MLCDTSRRLPVENANHPIPQRKRRFKRHNTQVYITRCYYEKNGHGVPGWNLKDIFPWALSTIIYKRKMGMKPVVVKIVTVLIVIVVEVVVVVIEFWC